MGNPIIGLLTSNIATASNVFIFKGSIFIPADFPTLAEVKNGWTYTIGANVTDNNPAKTNTGQSFLIGDEIAWNGSSWTELGSVDLWKDDGIDLFPVTDGRNIDLLSAGLKDTNVTIAIKLGDALNTSFTTTNKTIAGAINELKSLITAEDLWDRALFSVGIYYVTPHTSGDLVKIKDYMYFGLVDAFSRTQIWNYEANSVIRLGSLQQDGDALNVTSEGIVVYGQNAQGAAMSNLDWSYFRAKPYRLGLYNAKSGGYVGYLFLLDTQTNECYLRDNAGVKTFDFNRATGALTLSGLSLANGIVQTNSAGLLSTSVTLPNGTLATTQTQGDNSTKLATTAYVDSAVSAENTWDRVNRNLIIPDWYLIPHTSTDGLIIGNDLGGDYLKFKNITLEVRNVGLATNVSIGTDGSIGSIYYAGVSTTNASYFNLYNYSNAVSMAGTEHGIYFRQAYYDISAPNFVSEGYIGFGTEGNWTSTASTQNSYYTVRIASSGVLVDTLEIGRNEFLLYDIAGNNNLDFNISTGAFQIYGTSPYIYISDLLVNNSIELNVNDYIGNTLTSSGIPTIFWGRNKYNAASMTDTGVSLYFSQWYYDITTPAQAPLGNIIFATEGNWTSTASTQDGYFLLQNVLNGSLNDVLKISSAGVGTLYGICSYNFTPSFTPGSNQLATVGYVESLPGAKPEILQELTISSDGQTIFTLAQTPYNLSYTKLHLNGQLRRYLIDFTIVGTTLTWLNPGGLTLKATDTPLIVNYTY